MRCYKNNQRRGEKPRLMQRIGLTITFAFVVFLIFLITNIIVGSLSYLLYERGLATITHKRDVSILVFTVLAACTIVGLVVSLMIGSLSLKSTREFIQGMSRLADGDFSVRLDIRRPGEMRTLAVNFNIMAEELGGIELLRTDFVNNFSHEFKTPIMSIKGFAEMLKYEDLTKAERDEYLDIVISEAGRLAEIASNVLDLSKVEAQTVLTETEPFDLAEQIRHCILLLEAKWEEKKLDFSAEMEDITCVGNEELLSQVWINLMDNAIKFTPEGGSVTVILRKAGDDIVVKIRDSGCGIPENAQKKIFDKFYQADSSRATKGNGLGLTLSKRIIALHGGDISCESMPGEWTEFTVLLPSPAEEF